MNKSKIYLIKYLLIISMFYRLIINAGVIEANKYGVYINSYDARNFSLGDCWVTSLFNAGIGESEGFSIQYSPSIYIPTESRSIYLFDEFDNTVGKQTTAYNTNYLLEFPLTTHIYYNKNPMYLSIGWEGVIGSDWKFEDIERDDFYQIIRREEMESSININGIAFQGGWRIGGFKPIVEIKWLHGSFNRFYLLDTLSSEFYHKGSGYDIGGSLSYEFNWRFKTVIRANFGSRFKTPINDYEYPYRIGAGLIFRPSNRLPAVVTIEVIYTPWERMKVNGLRGEDLVNVTSISAGIEHRLKPDLFLRTGYLWNPSVISKNIIQSKFTFGVGYENWGTRFDIAGSYSTNSFTYDEVTLLGIGDYEILEESETRLILTITRMFEVK
jgi:hypothetical protein